MCRRDRRDNAETVCQICTWPWGVLIRVRVFLLYSVGACGGAVLTGFW